MVSGPGVPLATTVLPAAPDLAETANPAPIQHISSAAAPQAKSQFLTAGP
jgi:hypothetical protein